MVRLLALSASWMHACDRRCRPPQVVQWFRAGAGAVIQQHVEHLFRLGTKSAARTAAYTVVVS